MLHKTIYAMTATDMKPLPHPVTAPAHVVADLSKMPALRSVWRGIYTVMGALLGLAAGLVLGAIARAWPTWWLALTALPPCALMAWAGWRYAGWRYAAYRARWHPTEGLVVQRGVWWRNEVWVPVARLQHIDINQGPLDRRWGMASLTLRTAGTHDHATRIDGLPVAEAQELRRVLLAQAGAGHA